MHVLYVKTDRGNIVQSKNLVADSICIIIRQIDSVYAISVTKNSIGSVSQNNINAVGNNKS